jgi:hypothetical protein
MTTPNKDGWIDHDGGCLVRRALTEFLGEQCAVFDPACMTCRAWEWLDALVPATPATAGPSPFVRETAARIMAALMTWRPEAGHPALAQDAVAAALALEAALKEAGE